MSIHHANIAMLRALGRSLDDCKDNAFDAGPGGVRTKILGDLATACMTAAQDLENQERALVDRVIPAGQI